MKLVPLVRVLCVASVAIVILSGCASFPRNELPAAHMQPPEGSVKKPVVSYSFTSGIDLGRKAEHQENVRSLLDREFIEVFNQSGYFASVVAPGGQGDVNIQVRLVNSGSPAAFIPAFITGLSLYTIPSWVTDKYEITAKVRAQDQKEHVYVLTDSMRTVQWLPMIVMAPFKNMIKVSKEVRRNIWKTLILRMEADGVLAHSSDPVPMVSRPVPLISRDLNDIPVRLKQLKEMNDSGTITKEEYQSQRKVLMEKL